MGLSGGAVVVNPGGLVVPLSEEGDFKVPVSTGTYTVSLQRNRFLHVDSLCTTPASVTQGASATMSVGFQGRSCTVLNVVWPARPADGASTSAPVSW